MNVAISVVRPFHAAQIANALLLNGSRVAIVSSAPLRFFHGLSPDVSVRMIPAPLHLLQRILPFRLPDTASRAGIVAWDRAVAASLPAADLTVGFATQSLATGRTALRLGSRFILDRACPHVDFQQTLVREEAEKVGHRYSPEPSWFRDRQLQEYDVAEVILSPSRYAASTFPPSLQSKVVIAPLLGRLSTQPAPRGAANKVFTVGVLGGNPLRKGYLYLLQAWKELALPNARLLLRVGDDFARFPRLAELLRELPNVEVVGYVANIREFYRRCDVFCLPSVDDGFGMALCEAMAQGVPCIATRNCGASELLTDGVDSLIVPARDAQALGAALERFFRNRELRDSIGLAGHATMERLAGSGLYERSLLTAINRAGVPGDAGSPR